METESDDFPEKEPCLQESVSALDSLNKPQVNILLNTPGNPRNCLLSNTSKVSRAQTEVVSNETLDGLKNLKNNNFRNPFLSYLNINHIRNKIVDLRCILEEIGLEYISVSETKLDQSFPNSQFKIYGYHFPPFREDRTCHGGGLMVFVKKDIIAARLTNYEPEEIECICTQNYQSRETLSHLFSIQTF